VPVAAPPPASPRLPKLLDGAAIAAIDCADGCIELALIDDTFAERQADRLTVDTVRLTRVDLSGTRLQDLRIVDALLTDCNLANLHSRAAEANRVVIERSRLTGITLRESTLGDLTVRGSRVDLASFAAARLTRVTFEECLLTEATFIDAELDAVRFHDCDLTRADFRGARLRRCEFRRTELSQLEGVANLKGAAIDWPTIVGLAGVWAATLGITVLDEDA
jgi:uncharacterized protein YjbI with pentapeptide repeats